MVSQLWLFVIFIICMASNVMFERAVEAALRALKVAAIPRQVTNICPAPGPRGASLLTKGVLLSEAGTMQTWISHTSSNYCLQNSPNYHMRVCTIKSQKLGKRRCLHCCSYGCMHGYRTRRCHSHTGYLSIAYNPPKKQKALPECLIIHALVDTNYALDVHAFVKRFALVRELIQGFYLSCISPLSVMHKTGTHGARLQPRLSPS